MARLRELGIADRRQYILPACCLNEKVAYRTDCLK